MLMHNIMFAIILLLLIGGIAWVIYKLEFEQRKKND
jgi:hypothetical protein